MGSFMNTKLSDQCADSMRKACDVENEKNRKKITPPSSKACLYAAEIFQDIEPEEMERFNSMLPLKKFSAGEIIFAPYRSYQALFIVKSGRVRIFYLTESGKAFTLSIIEAGGVFGQMPIIGQHLQDSYVEAFDNSEICILKEDEVKKFLLQDPRIAVRIAQILGRKVIELEERLADLALKPLSQRLASLLLKLAKPSAFPWKQHHKTLNFTHEQIASLVGATREAVSKTLSDFAIEGLIIQSRGRITILEESELRARTLSQ